MKETIIRCDNCGKIIPEKKTVEFVDCNYVTLLCDYTGGRKICRPTLDLNKITVCLDCLVPFFQKWVYKIKNDPDYIF